MVVGSDPSAAASDITYNIGPQVRRCCSDLYVAFFCLYPWAGMVRTSRSLLCFLMESSKLSWGCYSAGGKGSEMLGGRGGEGEVGAWEEGSHGFSWRVQDLREEPGRGGGAPPFILGKKRRNHRRQKSRQGKLNKTPPSPHLVKESREQNSLSSPVITC